jgi:ankyrin repeat protein
VNTICEEKGYSALIAAVYNSDLPMLKLLLQADEICRKTYFSTQFSIISAVNSALKGTPEIVEEDLHINEDGVTEGETDGYLRTVDNTEKEYLVAPHTPHLVRALSDSTISEQRARSLKFAGKSNVVDIDGAGRNGMRALHYASQIGDIGIVGTLLQAGANREVFNNKLHTPLDVCLANNHIAAANAIRFDPEKVSICLAAKHGDWTVMSALLCQGVSINTQRNHMGKNSDALQHELYTPLLAAVAYGQMEIVKQILDVPGVDVNLANPLNQTALMFAAARGDESVVLLLLSRGADRWVLDSQGYIALAWAESRKRESIACILRHDPARVWVHDVIRNNDFAAVIGMLKQNVDINLRRYTKLVPHSPAASVAVGKLEAVGGSHGHPHATPERKGKSIDGGRGGRSPMFAGSPDAAAEAQDNTLGGGGEFVMGETPLIVAARYGRLDVIAILLKAPAPGAVQLNLADNAGNTALHHAAAKGQEEAVLALVKAHASRHARNLLGLTACLVAKSAGFPLIGAIIEADPYLVHIHDMCEQGDVRMVSQGLISFTVLVCPLYSCRSRCAFPDFLQ